MTVSDPEVHDPFDRLGHPDRRVRSRRMILTSGVTGSLITLTVLGSVGLRSAPQIATASDAQAGSDAVSPSLSFNGSPATPTFGTDSAPDTESPGDKTDLQLRLEALQTTLALERVRHIQTLNLTDGARQRLAALAASQYNVPSAETAIRVLHTAQTEEILAAEEEWQVRERELLHQIADLKSRLSDLSPASVVLPEAESVINLSDTPVDADEP